MHTIQISDELWELYDGSPQQMRDTLWQAKVKPRRAAEEEHEGRPGTVITLQWPTNCSLCRRPLFDGEHALIRTRSGVKEILCMDDARRVVEDDEFDKLTA